MAEREVIVIGAGLSGLSAGIFARLNGYSCRILEGHWGPGGVAASWRRGDYLFNGGIHFLMGHRPEDSTSSLFQELGVDLRDRVAEVSVYGRFLDENKGRRVDVTRDLDRLARDLKGYAGEDISLVEALVSGMRRFRNMDCSGLGLSHAPELDGRMGRLMDLWTVRRAWRSLLGIYGRSMADFSRACTDPWLQNVLVNLVLPDVPVWFVCRLLARFADGGLGYLRNGTRDLILSLEKRFLELGGEVRYKAPVEKILVENGRAGGVRLEDGQVLRAGAVISAADSRETLFSLLGGTYVDKAAGRRFADWKLSPAFLVAAFGLARDFHQDAPLTFVSLMHPIPMNTRRAESVHLRIFNYSPVFAPRGKTVLQAVIEADFDYWQGLRDTDPARYAAEKRRVAEEVVKRLEKHYPGISGQVEVTDVATPATVWRYTRNHRGAALAWMPTPSFFRTPLPRTLKGLADFYLAGQWAAGSGILPCLFSGRQAVELLCRSDRKPFRV